VQIDLIIG